MPPSDSNMIDDLLGLGGMVPGKKNVDKEGGIIDEPPTRETTAKPVEDDVPRHRPKPPPPVKDEGDKEPEYQPLPDEAEDDQPAEEPETEEEEDAEITPEARELALYRKLMAGEDPYEEAGMETPPELPSMPSATPHSTGREGQPAKPSSSQGPIAEQATPLDDPYEGLDTDDPEYIRMKRLEAYLEQKITRNAMTKVGAVVDEVYNEKEAAMALMRDTFEKYPWLREPGRPQAFDKSMAIIQQKNPGITDGRRLLDLTAKSMAKALGIDPKTGRPSGKPKTTDAEDPDKAPPAEKPTRKTRGAPKKKLTGEAAVIADSMKGFRNGGFF